MVRRVSLIVRFAAMAGVALAGCTVSMTGTHAAAAWFGAWDYVLRQDAEGAPQAALARLRGEAGSTLWLSCSRQAMEDEKPSQAVVTAAVVQKQFLGRSDPRGRSTVYWFDGGSPEVGHWIYRDRSGQIPDPQEVKAFIDRLAQAQSLVVELSNYRYETKAFTFRFDKDDTRNLADRFRKDCRAILGQDLSGAQS